MVTEGPPSMESVTNSHETARLPNISYMADYLDERFAEPAEKVPSKNFNVDTEKQNYVLNTAGALLRISEEFPKKFPEEVFRFLHSSVL